MGVGLWGLAALGGYSPLTRLSMKAALSAAKSAWASAMAAVPASVMAGRTANGKVRPSAMMIISVFIF